MSLFLERLVRRGAGLDAGDVRPVVPPAILLMPNVEDAPRGDSLVPGRRVRLFRKIDGGNPQASTRKPPASPNLHREPEARPVDNVPAKGDGPEDETWSANRGKEPGEESERARRHAEAPADAPRRSASANGQRTASGISAPPVGSTRSRRDSTHRNPSTAARDDPVHLDGKLNANRPNVFATEKRILLEASPSRAHAAPAAPPPKEAGFAREASNEDAEPGAEALRKPGIDATPSRADAQDEDSVTSPRSPATSRALGESLAAARESEARFSRAQPPRVSVHIGTVEIRAVPAPPKPKALVEPSSTRRPRLSLDEYLRAREVDRE